MRGPVCEIPVKRHKVALCPELSLTVAPWRFMLVAASLEVFHAATVYLKLNEWVPDPPV